MSKGQRSALTELLRRPKVPPDWGTQHTLWVHDDNVIDRELVINPLVFPTLSPGQFLALVNPKTKTKLYILVKSVERGPFKQASFQLSIHKSAADSLGVDIRSEIYVRILEKDKVPKATAVQIVFRDQYIGRLPMGLIRDKLIGDCAFVEKKIDLPNACVKAKILGITDENNKNLNSAYLGDDIVSIFRSETAKISILIQISEESNNWDSVSGQTFLEKSIDGFLADLFKRWKDSNVDHIVSVIFFYRIILENNEKKDYYSVAVEWETNIDWKFVLPKIRIDAQNCLQFVGKIGNGRLSRAQEGNFLESVHLALMMFDKHFVDRDLSKTGMSVVVVTPGNGYYSIKTENGLDLCRLAKRKIVDDGIWLQVVCLDKEPLHVTPLLEITDEKKGYSQKYCFPYWMKCGFYHGNSQWSEEEHCHYTKRATALTLEKIPYSFDNASVPSILSAQGVASEFSLPNLNLNPCDPFSTPILHCPICSNRWSVLFERVHPGSGFTNLVLDWINLVTPPCLPLKTLFTVTESTLNDEFNLISSYSVSLPSENIFLHPDSTIEDLGNELVAFRVAVGLQETQCFRINSSTKGSCLTFGHEVHLVDVLEDSILVRRFVRKSMDGFGLAHSLHYVSFIKPRLHDNYSKKITELKPTSMEDYPWESIDNMISGNERYEVPNALYWESRFVLIPSEEPPRNSLIMATAANEILDDEELRIAGFLKFMESFQRSSITRPIPSSSGSVYFKPLKPSAREVSSVEALKIQITTSTSSVHVQQEASRIEGSRVSGESRVEDSDADFVGDVEPLSIDKPLDQIIILMQHPLVGLKIKNRRWHWRIYRFVFIGSEAVDWMLKFFDDLKTREEAVRFGETLIEQNVWEHIFGSHGFLDGYYYYRFKAPYDLGTLRKSNPKILRTVSFQKDHSSTILSPSSSPENNVFENDKKIPIIMSRSIVLDVDYQRRSVGRREWAFLHFDSTHNPCNAYHFRIHWLMCSARLIEDMIQSWSRRAQQCGFVLIEAPVEAPSTLQNSTFQSPLFIKFAVPPPDTRQVNQQLILTEQISRTFFAEEILREHGFVLDFESDECFVKPSTDADWRIFWSYDRPPHERTQYIHRSGVGLVQVAEDGFYWSSNRLLLASTASRNYRPSLQSPFFEMESNVRQALVNFCTDSLCLSQFWTDSLNQIMAEKGMSNLGDMQIEDQR